jgi:hypothetical protein
LNIYPNQTMLQIIEGERGGVPVLPPVRPGDEQGPARRENILDILADAVRRRRIPDPATKKGQDVVDRIARAGVPPQETAGGDDACFISLPLPAWSLSAGITWHNSCLLSRDTATLIGVNVLLLVALIAGALMIARGPIEGAVRGVAKAAL